ncbi:MAG: hypothetical protein VR69_05255 [Peptococcaceae bacterium BRH_c4b]|nr:MAG: hypothetical protein VR69_05255 [Peptococcaceae bacterium BRH_c4b]
MPYINAKTYTDCRTDTYMEAKRSLQERFANPIIKVSVSNGVLINRLQSFWSTQNLNTREKSAS